MENLVISLRDQDASELTLHDVTNCDRLVIFVTDEDDAPAGMYLDRTNARALRDALSVWIGDPR